MAYLRFATGLRGDGTGYYLSRVINEGMPPDSCFTIPNFNDAASSYATIREWIERARDLAASELPRTIKLAA